MGASDIPLAIFWLAIAAITISSFYFRHKTQNNKNEVIKALVEKDQPLPPGLFAEAPRRKWDSRGFMAAGILLLGVSFGTLLFFWALSSQQFNHEDAGSGFLPFLSAFPFGIGIACIVVSRYLKSHD